MKLPGRKGRKTAFFSNQFKNNMVSSAGIISYIILLIMRIPLIRVIGDAGVGMMAPAFEIFLLATLFTSYGMSRAVTGLVRYRVKRDQHRNARAVFRAACGTGFFSSIAMALLVFVTAAQIADMVALEAFSKMAVQVTAAAIIFASLTGAFRGYFNGYGLGMLVAYSYYIEKISMLAAALICGRMFFAYGEKVGALLQESAYAYAYGAVGVMVGVTLSQIIAQLYLLILYGVYAGALKGRIGGDTGRRAETVYSVQRMIVANVLPVALLTIFDNLFMLTDQRFFNHCMNRLDSGEVRTALWGSYYGKAAVIVGLGAALCSLALQTAAGRISAAYEREEYRAMRERLGRAVRRLAIVAFPMAVYIAVLANAVARTLFQGETDYVTGIVQKEAVVIVLFACCFLFGQIMLKVRMTRELLVATVIAFIVHVVSAYLLVQRLLLGIDGVICSVVLFFGVLAVLSFVLISHSLKYKQEWVVSIAFPAAAAVVSGLAVMLLNKFLLPAVGGVLTILAGCFVGLILYIMLLMIFKVIGEAELSEMPFGTVFIILGRNIGVL